MVLFGLVRLSLTGYKMGHVLLKVHFISIEDVEKNGDTKNAFNY